ncbi:MAG: hypothetical protein UHN41_07030 [Bacteroidales bacterium]|nr:hypothetical protein [Bacteroidales bacterium]
MRKNLRKVLWLIAMLVLTSSAFAQRIAVLNFNAGAGVKQNEVDGLSAIFGTYFKPKGAKFIERTRVDKVLQEYKMQKSILTNTDMVAMGEQLNASLVVVGDVTIMLGEYNIDVRVVNVQTAEVVAGDGISFDTNTSPRTTMQHLGERLSKSVELEIEKFKIEEKVEDDQSKGGGSTLPKNMTTKITEDNSKRDRTDVVVLYDYLRLYPEDLSEYKNTPYTLIKKINEEEKYGYDSWRLPTEEEMDIIRSDGYLSGLKYMTQSDPRGVLLLVTTKDPVVHKSKSPFLAGLLSVIYPGAGHLYATKEKKGFGFRMGGVATLTLAFVGGILMSDGDGEGILLTFPHITLMVWSAIEAVGLVKEYNMKVRDGYLSFQIGDKAHFGVRPEFSYNNMMMPSGGLSPQFTSGIGFSLSF